LCVYACLCVFFHGVNFTNMFTQAFTCEDSKSANRWIVKSSVSFCAFGIFACKTLVNLTHGVLQWHDSKIIFVGDVIFCLQTRNKVALKFRSLRPRPNERKKTCIFFLNVHFRKNMHFKKNVHFRKNMHFLGKCMFFSLVDEA